MSVDFFTEDSPLGTAGSVKAAYNALLSPEKAFREEGSPSGDPVPGTPPDGARTFLILGGDAYLEDEAELASALALHRRKNAAMTVLLSRSDAPTEFGLATLDGEGTLVAFREKPSWAQVDGDLVSTGIYFLEERLLYKIPPGKYDFGYDLLHRLLTDREVVCGFPLSTFWCDVGTPAAYLQCQLRLTGGRSFHTGATLSEGVRLRASLLLPGVSMGKGASAEEAVIDEGCTVGPGARIGKGCVLGRNCHIGKDVILPPGTVLPEGAIWTEIPAPALRHEGKRTADRPKRGFPDGFFGDNRLIFSPAKGSAEPTFYLRLGRALAGAVGSFLSTTRGNRGSTPLRIAVGSDDSAAEIRELLLRGIAEGGAEACCLGEVTAGAAAYLARRLRFPLTVFLRYAGNGEFHGLLFDENRLYPGVPLERPLRERLSSDSSSDAGKSVTEGEKLRLRPGMRLYTETLAALLPPLDGRRITVSGKEREPLAAALRLRGALVREAEEPPAKASHGTNGKGRFSPSSPRGADSADRSAAFPKEEPARLFLHLSEGGEKLTASDAEKLLSPWQVIALCAGDAMRRGAGVISLPDAAPEALKTMVRRGGSLRCFSHTCADARESAARNLAGDEDYLLDASFAAAHLLRLMTDASLTLREAAALLPVFSFTEAETEVGEKKKASLLAAFAAGGGEKRLTREDGEFRLLPSRDGVLLADRSGNYLRAVAGNGTRLCITAEAGDDADADALLKRAKAFFGGK